MAELIELRLEEESWGILDFLVSFLGGNSAVVAVEREELSLV